VVTGQQVSRREGRFGRHGRSQIRELAGFIPATGQTFPTVLRSGGNNDAADNRARSVKRDCPGRHLFARRRACPHGGRDLGIGRSRLWIVDAHRYRRESRPEYVLFVTAGAERLCFARNNSQTLTLKSGLTLPSIIHSGSGTLQIAGANLSAASFSQTSAPLISTATTSR